MPRFYRNPRYKQADEVAQQGVIDPNQPNAQPQAPQAPTQAAPMPVAQAPVGGPMQAAPMDPIQVFGEQLQILTRSVNMLVDLYQQLSNSAQPASPAPAPAPSAQPTPQEGQEAQKPQKAASSAYDFLFGQYSFGNE